VIYIIELPFTLGIADEQLDIVRLAGADLKQDIFTSVWRLAMIEYALMPRAELVRDERHKPT
jgi:hypothetical protein